MKVKVSVILDLPDLNHKDYGIKEDVNLQDIYTGDVTYEKALLLQNIFDNFTNYALQKHMSDALHWLSKAKGDKNSSAYMTHLHHEEWAEILRASDSTLTIEKLPA
jgi:hypothetical protein